MSGLGRYLPALETARVVAQHAHAEGWQKAKVAFASATADVPASVASSAERAKELTADGVAWARENPGKATIYGAAGAIGLVTVAAPGAVAAPALALAGFGSNGIVGGSLAAGIQAGIGNVVAPSLFATCQSAAMGGYGVAAVTSAVQAGGAVLTASAGGAAVIGEMMKGKGERPNEQEEKENKTEEEARDEQTGEQAHL